ncbi:MAG: DUF2127 domain-containing protein [Terracidiphilus sp.]
MTSSPTRTVAPRHHNGWLILIAAFKLGQALLFTAIAVGAIRLLHKDVADLLAQLADHMRFNPESRIVNFLLEHAAIVDDRLLRRIGTAGFIYAGLDLAEGIGLYLEKAWAEYLTLAITASFLPLELWEIFRHVTLTRVSLFTVNALVFLYLLKIVSERKRRTPSSAGVSAGE